MKKLDKSRDYATIYGVSKARYEQDGFSFDHEGFCIDEKKLDKINFSSKLKKNKSARKKNEPV